MDLAEAGDTIWVKAGRCEEAVEIRSSGRIESIEFIGSGRCAAILLGITGVIEW